MESANRELRQQLEAAKKSDVRGQIRTASRSYEEDPAAGGYAEYVNLLLDAERKAALREGEIVVPGFEGKVAQELLLGLLEDEAVIREVLDDLGRTLEWGDVVAVLNAFKHAVTGDRRG